MPRLQGCRGLVQPKVCIHILRISQIFPLKFLWVPIPPRTGLPSLGHDFPPHWGFVQKHISYFEGKWVWYDGLCKHNFELACYSLLDSGEEAKVKGTRKVGGAGKKEGWEPLLSPVSSRFISVFALSQYSGPDYLGAWKRLNLEHTHNTIYMYTKFYIVGSTPRSFLEGTALIYFFIDKWNPFHTILERRITFYYCKCNVF